MSRAASLYDREAQVLAGLELPERFPESGGPQNGPSTWDAAACVHDRRVLREAMEVEAQAVRALAEACS